MATVTGVYNTETKAPYINLFKYYYTGQRDDLISPPLNLEGYDNVYLTFDYAYAQKYAQVDSLIVKVSSDCGNSWTRIYANGPDMTEKFVTREPMASSFAPEVKEDWSGRGNYGEDSPILDLSAWAGQSNIKIMFESYCGYGNNLYIDNIEVGNIVGINTNANNGEIKIFPNPVNDMLLVETGNEEQNSFLVLMNISGVRLQKVRLTKGINRIDVSRLSKGVYIVHISNNKESYTTKMIKN